jgi:hypothetical protein
MPLALTTDGELDLQLRVQHTSIEMRAVPVGATSPVKVNDVPTIVLTTGDDIPAGYVGLIVWLPA